METFESVLNPFEQLDTTSYMEGSRLEVTPQAAEIIVWATKHGPTPFQEMALRDLHGRDVRIKLVSITFHTGEEIVEFVRHHKCIGKIYIFAREWMAPHVQYAVSSGETFGYITDEGTRARVFHVRDGIAVEVWANGRLLVASGRLPSEGACGLAMGD